MLKTESSFNVLYTTDIEKTHQFYKKMGATIKQLEKDKVVVNIGSFELHFILNTTEPFEKYRYIAVPKNYGQGIIFYLLTDNIHDLPKQIEEAGGTLKSEVFENLWESYELLFEDPNGYKFAAYQEI
jgi:predicted enzyme related to lactoylglutathione lyase